MAGTFRGSFHSGNDSDRISEELFDAFNMDGYDDDRELRHRSKSSSRPVQGRGQSKERPSDAARRRKKKKDRQLIAMIGFSVLAFLLVVEMSLGIFLLDLKVLPVIVILVMNLAMGIVLGRCFIVAPIIMVVVEVAAGIFAGQFAIAFMGALLLIGVQAMCYALK